ncbi:ComEA family DNA-binding protein [Photobacterium profundum]|uniref:ComEA family DNA-binding protein n=1 Tax=Photobacterium profundum TaxID=74109 RepID=UPI003D0ABAC6
MKTIIKMALFSVLLLLAPLSQAATEHEGIEIKVNINNANAEELDKLLIGIGPEKAESIIIYRKEKGDFQTADDLINVKGIGLSTVDKNRKRIEL